MEFKKSIGIFNNAFSAEECNRLIASQELAIANGLANEGGWGGLLHSKKSLDFDLIQSNRPEDEALGHLITSKFNEYNTKYCQEFAPYGEHDGASILYGQTYYPVLQIQKYDKGLGHFNSWHLEEYGPDVMSRLFVFILYLNDVDDGGETAFYFKEDGEDDYFKVKPEAGKLIVHPASWPYVHKGLVPHSSDKYILTAWSCFTN